jgi:pyridoxine 4-dehydrogenase
VTGQPAVVAAARTLGRTASQVGLAWLLRHDPNALLVPGTANAEHLVANVATGTIVLDDATLATLDGIPIRPGRLDPPCPMSSRHRDRRAPMAGARRSQ